MRKMKLIKEQRAFALRLAEPGTPVAEVCRQTGISPATFYAWKKHASGSSRTAGAEGVRRGARGLSGSWLA